MSPQRLFEPPASVPKPLSRGVVPCEPTGSDTLKTGPSCEALSWPVPLGSTELHATLISRYGFLIALVRWHTANFAAFVRAADAGENWDKTRVNAVVAMRLPATMSERGRRKEIWNILTVYRK